MISSSFPDFFILSNLILFLPAVKWFENKGISSKVSGFAVVTLLVLVGTFAIARFIPISYNKGLNILSMAPSAAAKVESYWIPLLQDFADGFGFDGVIDVQESFSEVNFVEEIRVRLQSGLVGLWATGTTVLGGVFNVALIPVITFFIIIERKNIGMGMRSYIPVDWVSSAEEVLSNVNNTLRNVIKGQLTVAGILTIMYIIGFGLVNMLFGFPSAISIAIIAGACRVVPYLDIIVGVVLSGVVITSDFQNWGQVIGVLGVISAIQIIDGTYITPRVIGQRVGLHPLIVILSVLAFADWFGFWGVLLAVPVVAVVKIILMALMPIYRSSKVFTSNH